MGNEGNDPVPSRASVASLVLAGGTVILDVAGTGGLLTFVSALGALAANRLDAEEMRSLLDRTASIEERLRALQASRAPVHRITGDRVKVLASNVETEANEIYEFASADEVMEKWGLTADEYREAARELEALGLVRVHPGGNSPSGIARTALEPEAFLRVAPAMLEDVSVADEFLRVLRGAGRRRRAGPGERRPGGVRRPAATLQPLRAGRRIARPARGALRRRPALLAALLALGHAARPPGPPGGRPRSGRAGVAGD